MSILVARWTLGDLAVAYKVDFDHVGDIVVRMACDEGTTTTWGSKSDGHSRLMARQVKIELGKTMQRSTIARERYGFGNDEMKCIKDAMWSLSRTQMSARRALYQEMEAKLGGRWSRKNY
ncbi:hypothetical protein K461DRAFT_295376 [Myriangium duriaei CBS 260.36]|uniref:Uncharacterized protein n=1 Tax=Myriangium duriaei CBS 260.36 TaxID=1168546 RepID=A0A9P4IZ21_9PEZI|nr:hypothetical protein K461DRAFT_295376 [Myriangium duriaei CBS 260.36]